MSLRNKITFLFIFIVSGILLISFVLIYWLRYTANNEEFYNRLYQKAITTSELLVTVQEIDSKLLKTIDLTNKDILYKENITVYTHENKEIYTSNDTINFTIDNKLLNEIRLKKELRYEEKTFKIIGLNYSDKFNNVVVIAGAEDIAGVKRLGSLRKTLIVLYFIILAFVGLIGWLFAGKTLQPINDIIIEIDTIYTQNLDNRIRSYSNDELGKLAHNFNGLLDKIQQAFILQQTFITNFSHELKNPLMKMVAQIEVSLLRKRTTEEYEQTLISVLEDLSNLNLLSDSLLQLSKVNNKPISNLLEWVRVDELLFDAREEVVSKNTTYRVLVDFNSVDEEDIEPITFGNPHLLKTAFINLLDNGCKFSNDQITNVIYGQNNCEIILKFINKGKGIQKEEVKMIFEPFFRGTNAHSILGYGIGLSIVKKIIIAHQGNIQIETTEDTTTFIIKLPLSNQV